MMKSPKELSYIYLYQDMHDYLQKLFLRALISAQLFLKIYLFPCLPFLGWISSRMLMLFLSLLIYHSYTCLHSLQYPIEELKMRRQKSLQVYKTSDLTLNFGDFVNPRTTTIANPFQRVKSEMLKRRQRLAIRKKPMQYAKLELSLQDKLKQKSFNAEQQRDQLIMLQKCKNYFQMRKGFESYSSLTPKHSIHQPKKRPQTSTVSVRNSLFIDKLKNVMKECSVQDREQCQMKQNMGLFAFYCNMMDRRLEGIKNNIEKKERMI